MIFPEEKSVSIAALPLLTILSSLNGPSSRGSSFRPRWVSKAERLKSTRSPLAGARYYVSFYFSIIMPYSFSLPAMYLFRMSSKRSRRRWGLICVASFSYSVDNASRTASALTSIVISVGTLSNLSTNPNINRSSFGSKFPISWAGRVVNLERPSATVFSLPEI
jgi:hypothetical protein